MESRWHGSIPLKSTTRGFSISSLATYKTSESCKKAITPRMGHTHQQTLQIKISQNQNNMSMPVIRVILIKSITNVIEILRRLFSNTRLEGCILQIQHQLYRSRATISYIAYTIVVRHVVPAKIFWNHGNGRLGYQLYGFALASGRCLASLCWQLDFVIMVLCGLTFFRERQIGIYSLLLGGHWAPSTTNLTVND